MKIIRGPFSLSRASVVVPHPGSQDARAPGDQDRAVGTRGQLAAALSATTLK